MVDSESKSLWLWPLLGVLALAAVAGARYWNRPPSPGPPAAPVQPAQHAPSASSGAAQRAAAEVARHLTASGWPADAAEEVAALNEEFLGMLAEEAPEQVDQLARSLARLGRQPGVMELVRRHPETAGLLAAADDPNAVADSLRSERQYGAASNIYSRHSADSAAVAAALQRHGALISQLIDEGLLGVETVFLFPRGSQAAEAYDRWLDMAFQSALSDEAQLAALFQLVLVQGEWLRRRMIDEPEFQDELPSVVWPRLQRLDERGAVPMELAALDENLFQLLREPHGERLARRWGLLPLELLYGADALPGALHPMLIDTMLAGDNATLHALQRMGDEPLLAELLAREDLTAEVKAAALNQLQAAGSDYPAKLQKYSELKPTALADEVGPPPSGPVTWLPLYYTIYEVPKKIMQGRNPTMMDAAIAVLDPVFLAAGPLGPDDIIKVAGQQSARAAHHTGKAVAGTLRTAAQSQASRQLGAAAARQLGAREAAPWLITQMLRGTRRAVQRKLQSAMTVDITGPTRFLFRVTGVARKSFQQLSRLEAKLLLRPDGRVLIRLDRFLVGHPAGRFLADTAIAGLVETSVEIPTVENAAVDVVRGVNQLPDQAAKAKVRFTAWQKNMSAWWLTQAMGMWDEETENESK